ncbi:MAG: hypothetical protein QOC94_2759 [Actinoplanes sp.]|jgi:hypothetical protein|nr:hypothetical protein [Actinoplanes sp.]MDT5032588.1 hypothetical protein [Actinoplanes sp.]
MGYVDDAFAKLKRTLEITKAEEQLASRRHNEIRDHVCAHLQVVRHFLTGSYKRETKTKKLKDVDIFFVIDSTGADADLRDLTPDQALQRIADILKKKYTTVTIGRRSCTIEFDTEEEIVSFDIVPAFDRDGGGYVIPDRISGQWVGTDPTVHAAKATAKNAACDGKWIPFVKMVKGYNREAGKPVRPSFLLEVMALDLVKEPFGRYQDEMRWFLASAADRITDVWPDPAGLGPDVNSSMTSAEKQQAATALREALAIAETAIRLEDDGHERAAVEEWRKLFGWRMPRPW